jgi:hypothetical protein
VYAGSGMARLFEDLYPLCDRNELAVLWGSVFRHFGTNKFNRKCFMDPNCLSSVDFDRKEVSNCYQIPYGHCYPLDMRGTS